MPAIINYISNINVFAYIVNAILLVTMTYKPKLIRSTLLILTMASTLILLTIDDHLHFITMWVWVSVLLFLTSLQTDNNSSRKHHFSQYTTYILADLIFFFMSLLLEVKFGKLFLILPIIVRCNLIPFQFFASVGSVKNLRNELQLTTVNFLSVFIFLHKFHIDSEILIRIITVSLFITSFRFIRNASSTNIINLFYIMLLNMCVFLTTHGFSQFAQASFIFFFVIFAVISQLIPENITASTLRHIDNFKVTPEKILPLIIFALVAFLPFTFTSTVYLSVFELITFKTWYIGQNHFVAIVLFALILWFMINIHCAFSLIFNLVTHLPSPEEEPTKLSRYLKFVIFLPIILIFASSYAFMGQFSFTNTSSIIPIQVVKANVEQYLIFFFTPILIFSIFGIYLRKILDLARFLLPIYAFILNATSLYIPYTYLSFTNIQRIISKSINMIHTFLKIVYRLPKAIYEITSKIYSLLALVYQKAMGILKAILDYKLSTDTIIENFHILLLFMTLLIIALSSTLSFSVISIVLMTITALTIGYFLSANREDPK